MTDLLSRAAQLHLSQHCQSPVDVPAAGATFVEMKLFSSGFGKGNPTNETFLN
ncbi:hypothetical protein B0H14DRAFT_3453995 [Mycena olivaceomarginata]|nr:hypothetical protein B0H14DRAFT_3453995 [Mycena olivaceomarginata]